jgi:hypothetical protein
VTYAVAGAVVEVLSGVSTAVICEGRQVAHSHAQHVPQELHAVVVPLQVRLGGHQPAIIGHTLLCAETMMQVCHHG